MIILAWQRYHADNLNEFNVKVYQPKPPEIPSEMAGYFVYKGLRGINIDKVQKN